MSGPVLQDFFGREPVDWPGATLVNGQLVGSGSADRIPDGPLVALLCLVNGLKRRRDTLP